MLKSISIGLKLFGIYLFYMTGDTILDIINTLIEKKIFDDTYVGYWLLTTTISKIILYATFGWILIFRNEFILSKFFNHKAFQEENSSSIRDLSHRELLFLLFKLVGFIFITQEVVLIFSSGFTYLGFFQIEGDFKWILLRDTLIQMSYKLLILILGLIMFFFTEKLVKWINE
ncbi:MAG: hypothetical protein RI922_2847 [Bacteroidota bacterium]